MMFLKKTSMKIVFLEREERTWFKVAVSVIDSDGPETYRSRIGSQNKMIKIFKNY